MSVLGESKHNYSETVIVRSCSEGSPSCFSKVPSMTLGECRIAAQPLRFHRRFWPLFKVGQVGFWMLDIQ